MGDPTTEEDIRGRHDQITLSPNGTEAIISSNLSVSHKILNTTMDQPEEKQHKINNTAEEKSENTTVRFCLNSSASVNSTTESSSAFLATLTSLSEHNDHMLLPHRLHQIAEAYFLEEDFQQAVHFLQLERLYHERLLSNLASMQKDWESEWKAVTRGKKCPVKIHCTEIETKCMDSLNHICRTHQRPNHSVVEKVTKESITVQQRNTGSHSKMNEWIENWIDPEEETEDEDKIEDPEAERLTEVARRRKLSGEEPSELIEVEETFPSNGLVSILKKRDESGPVSPYPHRNSSKFKVRFSESDASLDNDDAGEDSCLFFLVLCVGTVVISMGGTMIYCFLGRAYSNICSDFSHNMDFYFGFIRRAVNSLTHWFIPASS
ncbi:hypothetical protein Q7C36_002976 [Tachysurus vachellii]|uniref:Consortin C-terminal domain-containing protein n=1 Tax=Tachysurus vachellii TaxID=175792 RepID=A0AA88NP61_TACVA|nr:hypothetical protein Q7C36_002976 [Tachysurus vachellii]